MPCRLPLRRLYYLAPPPTRGFEDIWLRDLIGFDAEGIVFKPIYQPSYYDPIDKSYLKILNDQVQTIISDIIQKPVVNLPLIWDGGNLVHNSKYGFITNKIIDENPDYSKSYIRDLIKEQLQINPVFLPYPVDDVLGHMDGYMTSPLSLTHFSKRRLHYAQDDHTDQTAARRDRRSFRR